MKLLYCDSLYKPEIKPDAIFTASDRITTVCLDVLKRKQKKEVVLIGFTNTNIGDLFLTPLTVIRQPAFEIGQNATELLIRLIESKRPGTEFEARVLETELIIRESAIKKS